MGLAISEAGMAAVNCVLLIKVVVRAGYASAVLERVDAKAMPKWGRRKWLQADA